MNKKTSFVDGKPSRLVGLEDLKNAIQLSSIRIVPRKIKLNYQRPASTGYRGLSSSWKKPSVLKPGQDISISALRDSEAGRPTCEATEGDGDPSSESALGSRLIRRAGELACEAAASLFRIRASHVSSCFTLTTGVLAREVAAREVVAEELEHLLLERPGNRRGKASSQSQGRSSATYFTLVERRVRPLWRRRTARRSSRWALRRSSSVSDEIFSRQ